MAEKRQDTDSAQYSGEKPGRLFLVGWIIAFLVISALTAGLVMAREYWVGRQAEALKRRLARGPRVLVMRAMESHAARSLELPASIHGYIETRIYAKVAGYLEEIRVDKGDRVKRGEVLAILSSPELDHQVADARAAYNLAVVTDRREQILVEQNVAARQTADESHAAMLRARATLRQLEAMRNYETIRAPFDGVITARYVDQGALIPQTTTQSTVAATPIVAMATLRPLRVYVQAPQSAAPFIKDGDPAVVTVAEFPRREFRGAVTRHPEALNGATRTMLVEVDLPNEELQLYPGMYAKAVFTVRTPSGAPVVPDDALVFRDGKVYVPVVRNNRLRLADVTLGNDDGRNVEIRTGVEANDLVAINVGQAARDGEPVQPVFGHLH